MDKKNIIYLSLIYILLSVFLFAKTGNMLVDFSRESYIPYQILEGEKLFKDIFLIYGFFGYFINSIIYKISLNINLLIIEAHCISYFIILFFYFILRKFCSTKYALIFSVFFVLTSIFSNSTFSFVLPYSYSTLWAIFGLFGTLYFALENKKNTVFLCLGFIMLNRIEFFIPAFIVYICYLIYKKEKFLKNSLILFVFPIIFILYILLNKITLNNVLENIFYINKMIKCESIKNLYFVSGGLFEIRFFKYNLINFTIFVIISSLSYLIYRFNKPASYIITPVLLYFINTLECLNLILFFAIALFAYSFYKKNTNEKEMLLFLFSIILCLKALFCINPLANSNFGFCLMVFCVFLILSKYINKKWVFSFFAIFLIVLNIKNMQYYFINQKNKIKAGNQTIELSKNDFVLFLKVNDYINKNVKKNESFIVVPEGQIFNLIHNKPWGFYNSTFTPLDFETFGEEKIISQLKKNKTDYIIFYPRNTIDYGYATICYDYGVDFCAYIADNYKRVGIIEDNSKALIFKLEEK